MDAIWAALFAAAYFLCRRYPRGAFILFLAGLNHWLLDFMSHRPDRPLARAAHHYFGLGLWASILATVILEGAVWLLAVVLYARATHPKTRLGIYAF